MVKRDRSDKNKDREYSGGFNSQNSDRCNQYNHRKDDQDLFLSAVIPLLVIIFAWVLCKMDHRYHILCLVSLVLALLFFGVFTW